MSLTKMIKRSLVDLLDVPVLLTAFMLLYLLTFFVSPPIYDAMASSIIEYFSSGSFLKASYTFFSSLGVVGWIALLLYLIIYLYLFGFVVGRILQKRTGKPSNPFKRAVERIITTFVSLILISSVPFVFLLLFLVYYPLPFSNILFFLSIVSLLTWSMVSLPTVAVGIVENGKGRHIVYEGLLAGRVTWWKSLITIVLLSIVVWVISYAFSLFLPEWASFIYSVLSFLIVPIVAAESYAIFKEGS